MTHNTHVSLLYFEVNTSTFEARLIDSLCYVLVILGFVGNILGLFLFSSCRRTWRISSIYAFLATSSSITNLLCVIRYGFILHSKFRNILRVLVGQEWWACKTYEISFSLRIFSSWITLFWMFERLLCVSVRSRTAFKEWNSLKLTFIMPISLTMIILICVIGPPVYMFQPEALNQQIIVNSTIQINETYCQLNSKASFRWKKYFNELSFGLNHFTIRCLFSELIPTVAVIIFNAYIIYHIARTRQRLQKLHGYQRYRKQSQTTLWMTKVLLIHSFLFLTSLLSHVAAHFADVEAHETWWVLLAILMNSSLNFYIYCLSGHAFRNEIRRFIQRFKIQFLHIFHIQQQQRKRYSRNPSLTNETNNCQVIVPLKSYHFNFLQEKMTI